MIFFFGKLKYFVKYHNLGDLFYISSMKTNEIANFIDTTKTEKKSNLITYMEACVFTFRIDVLKWRKRWLPWNTAHKYVPMMILAVVTQNMIFISNSETLSKGRLFKASVIYFHFISSSGTEIIKVFYHFGIEIKLLHVYYY